MLADTVRRGTGFSGELLGEGVMSGMALRDEWDRLDSETRNWILQNPGCVLLPRTISGRIVKEAASNTQCDQHGQMVLSAEDMDFIREKARGDRHTGPKEYRFFNPLRP